MGSKYPVLPPEDIIKVLVQLGFKKVSQKGSHAKYVKSATYHVFIHFLHLHCFF
jgi:predicted RNA binding protein YcfA (HicA-like mRNA interferase family)